jgi:hypothetical protein
MGGGLMQLVAYGAQDVYLTGNPQITFFKVVYRRHTNFAVEPIQQVYNGSGDFGRQVTCTINRNGDLITNMYAVIDLPAVTGTAGKTWGYVRRLGYALVQETKVEIGGSKIDEQYGDWLNIWYELSHKVGQERGFAKMVGDSAEFTSFTQDKDASVLYVPLGFWFNRHNGLALPLIALQYHDVRVTVQFRSVASCVNLGPGTTSAPAGINMVDSYLLIDYVYLDSEERKRFAQASHEYLIEQLQFTGSESVSGTANKYRLNFNHPSKFLLWSGKDSKYSSRTDMVVYADNGDWKAASERFARIVWLATRKGLDANGAQPSGWELEASVSANQDVNTVLGSAALSALAAKVEAVALASSGNNAVSINDVVLTKNETTAVDWSISADDLTALLNGMTPASATPGVSALLSSNTVSVQDHFNYGCNIDRTQNPVLDAKIQLNGHDRFTVRDGNYFNYVQPWQHFSNTPSDGVNVYSFALKPEEHQPSGTCNFSRIDNATLNVNFSLPSNTKVSSLSANSECNIYTVNYNVLRVMSGMAGTAYSN